MAPLILISRVAATWQNPEVRSIALRGKQITPTSGEVELAALVQCSGEAIGVLQLAADWGLSNEDD